VAEADFTAVFGIRTRIKQNYGVLAVTLLFAAIIMNFVLALINNLVLTLNANVVVATQLVITLSGLLIVIAHPPRITRSHYLTLGVFVICFLLASLIQQTIDFRFLYGVLVLQAFLLLGYSVDNVKPIALNWLLFCVSAVAVIEALLPDVYTVIVNPLHYYLSTREWVAQFVEQGRGAVGEAGLYVGAARSGGSVFGLADHRVGSIFLEPLSLSYFCVVMSLVYAHYYQFNLRKIFLPISTCLLVSILSDTRTATVLIVLFLLAGRLVRFVPLYMGLVLPLSIFAILGAIYVVGKNAGLGELAYRLSITYEALGTSQLGNIIFGGIQPDKTNDSAILSLVAGAGALGTLVYFYLSSGLFLSSGRASVYTLMIMFFMITVSFFGGVLFSIKTAAITGFMTGMICASARSKGDWRSD
jgi:hypothetical protein